MNHLQRELAPVSDAGWSAIEEEAARALRTFLAARKLVDFSGPLGWEQSAVNTGRVTAAAGPPCDGVEAAVRQVQPLVELRTPFEVSRAELEAIDRGTKSPDLSTVVDAARRAARAEDHAVFHGYAAAGIGGIAAESPHDPIVLGDDYEEFPRSVARAVALLRDAGVDAPYGIALGPKCYEGVIETTQKGGYPVLEQLRLIASGPLVWAPEIEGSFVLSTRGGDFELTTGEDFAIGYAAHTAETMQLFLEESFTFLAHSPEAAVALVYA